MREITEITLVAGLAGVACLAACSGGGSSSAGPETAPPVDSSLAALSAGSAESPDLPEVDPTSLEAWEEAAIDLQRLLDERHGAEQPSERPPLAAQRPAGGNEVRSAESPEEGEPDAEPTALATLDAGEGADSAPPAEPDQPDQPAETAPTPDAVVAEAAEALRQAVLARAMEAGDPGADARRMAILEGLLFEPGEPSWALNLTPLPDEQARLVALRELARELEHAEGAGATLAALESAAAGLQAGGAAFAVREALLATSVEGFGQYEPWGERPFLAGQPNRVLLYTELERFGHRRTLGGAGGDGPVSAEDLKKWEVELSQEATLYHDAPGDLQVWHHPRARIRERSRNQRRDFYLVNEIVLPARLSVGRYRLKVVTRDEVSGAVAERVIPVELVADPALVRAGE